MTVPPDVKVTSDILWQAAALFLVVDAPLVFVLAHRKTSLPFRRLKWTLVVTTAVFWSLLWLSMCVFFWEPVYRYVFPDWSRWFIPPVYGLFFGVIGLLFWWLALRRPGNAVIHFLFLGGTWGTITHVWAISRGILEKPPMLQGVSPLPAVVLPFFEFTFYWSIILGVAALIHGARQRRESTRGGNIQIAHS